jgi:subtilisin family serine protease
MAIALPLIEILHNEEKELEKGRKEGHDLQPRVHSVIIDLNLEHPGGRKEARLRVLQMVSEITEGDPSQGINNVISERSQQYLFAELKGNAIRELVRRDNQEAEGAVLAQRAIYRIWPDFEVEAFINKSISTVKADAARTSFSAFGEGIVWAVLDSGIDATHPHFQKHKNLELDSPLTALDFTVREVSKGKPNEDEFGHGTHVAGIIAGEMTVGDGQESGVMADKKEIIAVARQRDENGDVTYQTIKLQSISGMAPKCKLLSLKVLDDKGKGKTSSLIAALDYIQEVNGYGRRLRIHGVNMSVGYDFEPKWFACGQSPLCVEVDRLVRSGVVVVVAAGNTGHGSLQSAFRGPVSAGMDLTINDPGNAELAITVGSTHRDMPHVYGVSYFSSKGPTGDGRAKPDLVAPGEKILSCAGGKRRQEIKAAKGDCEYLEDSGTSMAAPHVSGVIAAFLSVRREFIGQSEKVKQIFLSTATDLKRERYFQGYGLVDLMRAIQSV